MGAEGRIFRSFVLLHREVIVGEVLLRLPDLLTILRCGRLSVGVLYMTHIPIHIASRHHDALISTNSNSVECSSTGLNLGMA